MGNFDQFSRLPSEWFKRHSSKYDKERALYNDMSTEMINHHGVLCEYIFISNDPQYDPLFGDDRNRRALRKFDVMMYFDLPNEEDRWSGFGIEGLDNFSMFCTIQHYNARSSIGQDPSLNFSPRVGDFVKPRYSSFYYEITAWYDSSTTSINFLQSTTTYEFVVAKITNDHILDPDGLIKDRIRDFDAKDIFDDTDFVNAMNGSTDAVPDTFPATSGKGKPSPLYKPRNGETAPNDPFGGF